MPKNAFNEHKLARDLPISKTTSDLLVAVDKQLKHLPTDVRHTYGREYILLLLEMRRLVPGGYRNKGVPGAAALGLYKDPAATPVHAKV